MIEDISVCYRILELEPGASLPEVKRSYRDLVRVWHPDRFPNDPKLQKRGEEKLKQINLAYERICKSDSVPPHKTPKPEDADAPQPMNGSNASSGTSSQGHRDSSRQEAPSQAPRSNQKSPIPLDTNLGRRFMQIAAIVVVIMIFRAVFSTDAGTRRQTKDYSPPFTKQHLELEPSTTFAPATPSSQQSISKDAPESPSPSIPVIPTSRESENGAATNSNLAGESPTISPNSSSTRKGYFTVGSTKDEVLAVQGTPTEFTDTIFTYQFSKVFFANGRVTTWQLHSLSPLKARLLPTASVEAKDFFSVGSTKDEVLAVQGTPTEFTDTIFTYQFSKVLFANGRVTTWELHSLSPLRVKLRNNGYPPLKEQILPTIAMQQNSYFTVGSTRDEVLATQGTPDRFTDFSLNYGTSSVIFENDRVRTWNNGYPPLKVKLVPSASVQQKSYFTVGSTRNEVLATQGTPDRFTEFSLSYGTSSVIFENGRVKSWNNGYPKLKVQLMLSAAVQAKSYFTLGSTGDEVLAIQGTPDSFTSTTLSYGSSSVTFENGRVKSWNNGYPQLKVKLLSFAAEGELTGARSVPPLPKAAGTPYRITGLSPGDALNVRGGPGVNHPVVTQLHNGMQVEVVGGYVSNGPDRWLPCLIEESITDPVTGLSRPLQQKGWINSMFVKDVEAP